MCEASVFCVKDEKQELVLADVEVLRPEGEFIFLKNIFGEQKRVKGRIREMNLVEHRILLDVEDTPGQ
jgi:predicted RNA-binding protein